MGVGCWGLAVLGLGLGFEAEEDDHEVDDVVAHGGEHDEEHAHGLLVGEQLEHAPGEG